MSLPTVRQPDIETIASELTAWHAWTAAYYRKQTPLPELPPQEDKPSTAIVLFGIVVRCPLLAVGWLARKAGMPRLRQWCARMRVRLDWMVLCRAGCSLNQAFTELGLAVLETGDVPTAIECLQRSWQVHPCPHSTSFGLSPRLWVALAGIPGAEPDRIQYEKMARSFAHHSGVLRKRATLSEVVRTLYRALIRGQAEHQDGVGARGRRGSS